MLGRDLVAHVVCVVDEDVVHVLDVVALEVVPRAAVGQQWVHVNDITRLPSVCFTLSSMCRS